MDGGRATRVVSHERRRSDLRADRLAFDRRGRAACAGGHMSLKTRLARVEAVLGRPREVDWGEVYPAQERFKSALLAKIRAFIDGGEAPAVDAEAAAADVA